jgi:ureidoglycolate lyase
VAQQANRKLRQERAAISEFYTSYFVSAGFALCPDHSKCDLSIRSVRRRSDMQHGATREIFARPLSAEAFAPYGDVVEAPVQPGRAYFETSIENLRPNASPKLWMLTKLPAAPLPLEFTALERHRFSSQSFVPIEIGRWLVVVAPHGAQGRPALDQVEAFLARPTQGVSYRPDVWHGALTVFDKPARLNVFMWLDGTAGDEEIVPVPPFVVRER